MSLSGAAVLGAGFLQAAGSVYSNAVNSATQLKINQDNAALQYAVNMDQIEAARMNNETAIELSNTAHQREVRDLRDANLNPILSANGSGSSVPSLDTPGLNAPSLSAPQIDNPLAGIASAVQQAVSFNDQHQLNEARLAAAGFAGTQADKAELVNSLTKKAIQDVNTARQEADARQDEALARSQAAKLDEFKTRLERTIWQDFTDGNAIRSDVAALVRAGIESDLKVRANRNWRNNLSSAKGIVDSVRLLLPWKYKK